MRVKRVRVILNPHGGKGDAQQVFNQRILPLLQLAGIQCDLEITKYAGIFGIRMYLSECKAYGNYS